MLLFEMMRRSVVWSTETSMPLATAGVVSEVRKKTATCILLSHRRSSYVDHVHRFVSFAAQFNSRSLNSLPTDLHAISDCSCF